MFAFKITGENSEVFGDTHFPRYPRFFGTGGSSVKEGQLKKKLKKPFRCIDDDDVPYFWGFTTDDSSEDAFIPLDYLGELYGCTSIEYQDEQGNFNEL